MGSWRGWSEGGVTVEVGGRERGEGSGWIGGSLKDNGVVMGNRGMDGWKKRKEGKM